MASTEFFEAKCVSAKVGNVVIDLDEHYAGTITIDGIEQKGIYAVQLDLQAGVPARIRISRHVRIDDKIVVPSFPAEAEKPRLP